MGEGGTVYAGGIFNTIGSEPRNRIAALHPASGFATFWDANANAYVDAIATIGNRVYAGGGFSSIGGQSRNGIGALDDFAGAATGWDPNAKGPVGALALSGGTVYAGGGTSDHTSSSGFTSIGGLPQSYVAALSSNAVASVGDDTGVVRSAVEVGPNPARSGVQIQYEIVRAGRVRLELLDVAGRVVATLADQDQGPGLHRIAWNGIGTHGRVPSVMYVVRLTAPGEVGIKKLAINR